MEPASSLRNNAPRIQELSSLLGRTPGSIHRKLEDIRSNDPEYLKKGMVGTHAAKQVSTIWSNFQNDRERTMSEIENAYESVLGGYDVSEMFIDPEIPLGRDVPALSTYREGQHSFRRQVADNFDCKCCITGIATESLLVASHIKPWFRSTPSERTDVRNGLYLNRLHDGLFDRYLMTIDEDMRIVYAESIRQDNTDDVFESFFGKYEGARIRKPIKSVGELYLEEHRRISYAMWGQA